MADTPQSLLQRIAADPNDKSGWQRFIDLYTPFLQSILHSRAGLSSHDVDDIVQETLLIVIRKLPEFQHNQNAGAFRRWLREIVRHKLQEFQRKTVSTQRDIETIAEISAELEDDHSELAAFFDREHQRHILTDLSRLAKVHFSSQDWELFERVVLKGESPNEVVAASPAVSINMVYLAKSRILKWLRDEGRGLVDFD